MQVAAFEALILYELSNQFHTGTCTIIPTFHVPANFFSKLLYTLGLLTRYPPVKRTCGRYAALTSLVACSLISILFCNMRSSGRLSVAASLSATLSVCCDMSIF